MNDSQFAYSGLTLDELRSLAASPQVGTIQAMPQSFRALADRVGEVADLLTHAQADLPNWWKGSAAEQAAATLGRAAAEARDFHESATGAASAVSRCAQVVAEQQNQILNVPEVPEPGITDVVQRPTTPFEALEAARQSASYQAAHEQAVQVVNGIAAQYNETRSQLSNIGMTFGEDFTPSGRPTSHEPYSEVGSRQYSPAPQETKARNLNPQYPLASTSSTPDTAPIERTNSLSSTETPSHSPSSPINITNYKVEQSTIQASGNSPTEVEGQDPKGAILDSPTLPGVPVEVSDTVGRESKSAITDNPSLAASAAAGPTKIHSERMPIDEPYELPSTIASQEKPTLEGQSRRSTAKVSKKTNGRQIDIAPDKNLSTSSIGPDYPTRSVADNFPTSTPTPGHSRQPDEANSDYSPMIPPYGGLGSIHRKREERNPRPSYLKERKSAWLPDTVAVPADGVIGPDWPEPH